jgi:hypothetical protein
MNNRIARLVAISSALTAPIAAVADETTRTAVTREWSSEHAAKIGEERQKKDLHDSVPIAKCIGDIDSAVRVDKQRTLSIIVINTDVAAAILEKEKARTGFSFGEVYVAHSLALATHKKFDAIAKLKLSGKTWEQIAREHNVTLKGSRELLRQIREKQ